MKVDYVTGLEEYTVKIIIINRKLLSSIVLSQVKIS